jgi:hypothetical protein
MPVQIITWGNPAHEEALVGGFVIGILVTTNPERGSETLG